MRGAMTRMRSWKGRMGRRRIKYPRSSASAGGAGGMACAWDVVGFG